MGEVIKLKAKQAPVFTDMTDMLNQWWKAQSRKPLAKPMKIRHVVETAHSVGWSLEECYEALSITCLLYTSPSPRDVEESRMPSSA